ncbi:MAG: hypothetical protein IKQ33_01300 [Clostridia bacterium]|nr:hypothetical protein [Clostridia bacterium]
MAVFTTSLAAGISASSVLPRMKKCPWFSLIILAILVLDVDVSANVEYASVLVWIPVIKIIANIVQIAQSIAFVFLIICMPPILFQCSYCKKYFAPLIIPHFSLYVKQRDNYHLRI